MRIGALAFLQRDRNLVSPTRRRGVERPQYQPHRLQNDVFPPLCRQHSALQTGWAAHSERELGR